MAKQSARQWAGPTPITDTELQLKAEIARLKRRVISLEATVADQDAELAEWEAGRRKAAPAVQSQHNSKRTACSLACMPCGTVPGLN